MAARRLRPVARIRATVERLRAVRGVAEITDPVTMPARELAAGDGCAGSAPRASSRLSGGYPCPA